jgi:molecular chaperone GrpE
MNRKDQVREKVHQEVKKEAEELNADVQQEMNTDVPQEVHQDVQQGAGEGLKNDVPDGLEASADEERTTLMKEIERLREELQRFKDLAMRNQADLENFRKRMVREKEEFTRYANKALIERLLPLLDSFELGLASARQTPGAESIVQGFALVEKQFGDFLRELHVETIHAEGKAFDPTLHEAVSHEPDATVPAGNVSRQLRKGYKMRDRLLRPATVIVSSGPPPENAA